MKKLTKTLLKGMLGLGFIAFGSIATLSASGSGDNSQYINQSFTSNIDTIEIDITIYSIFIEIHDSNEVIVEADIENSRYANPLIVNISGNTLKIDQIEVKTANSNTFGSGTIVIKVPATSTYDYDMDLVFADIKMYAMGKDVWVNNVFSDIELFVPIENFDADSTFGTIKVTANRSSSAFSFNSTFCNVYISLLDDIKYMVHGSVKDEYNNRTSSYGDDSLSINVNSVFGTARLTDWQ